jgi:biopolymer transport protein TolR
MKIHKHKAGEGSVLSEINIVPLVDVILVLLIIFMVTAPLLEQGLAIELPQASSPAIERSEEDVILTIDADGNLFLMNDKKSIPFAQLEKKLQEAYRHRKKKEIFVRADKKVSYGRVAETMAMLKKVGIERMGMITEDPPRR